MLFVPDPAVERVRPPVSAPRCWIGWAGLASLLLHAAALGGLLLWLRQPRVTLHLVDQPATVQLVTSPPGSDHNAPPASPGAKGRPAKPGAKQAARPAPPDKTVQHQPPAPAQQHAASDTPTPAQPAPAEATPPAAAPQNKPAPNAFTLDRGAVESDTNALVTGNVVVPPSKDIRFHNRKPSYPDAAALRGEQGTVLLLVHVQPDGLVSMVDVARSSGYARLDDAARDAVQTWRFLPAVKNGQPIASEVPVRIVYALDQ